MQWRRQDVTAARYSAATVYMGLKVTAWRTLTLPLHLSLADFLTGFGHIPKLYVLE